MLSVSHPRWHDKWPPAIGCGLSVARLQARSLLSVEPASLKASVECLQCASLAFHAKPPTECSPRWRKCAGAFRLPMVGPKHIPTPAVTSCHVAVHLPEMVSKCKTAGPGSHQRSTFSNPLPFSRLPDHVSGPRASRAMAAQLTQGTARHSRPQLSWRVCQDRGRPWRAPKSTQARGGAEEGRGGAISLSSACAATRCMRRLAVYKGVPLPFTAVHHLALIILSSYSRQALIRLSSDSIRLHQTLKLIQSDPPFRPPPPTPPPWTASRTL